jgi:hypothetical protein
MSLTSDTYLPDKTRVLYRSKNNRQEKIFDALDWLGPFFNCKVQPFIIQFSSEDALCFLAFRQFSFLILSFFYFILFLFKNKILIKQHRQDHGCG